MILKGLKVVVCGAALMGSLPAVAQEQINPRHTVEALTAQRDEILKWHVAAIVALQAAREKIADLEKQIAEIKGAGK